MTAPDSSSEAYRDFERDGWQRAAARYATSFERVTGAHAGAVLDALALAPGRRLLDVACGPGILVGMALDRELETVGIDFSAAMVDEARRRHTAAEIHRGDAEALPFADARFDGVAINFGILHFAAPARALTEAIRVLSAGGGIAFTVWASPRENRVQGHVFDAMADLRGTTPSLPPPPGGLVQTPDDCRRLLAAAGFGHIEIRPLRRAIEFRDSDELLRVLGEGTVQTAAALASLAPSQHQALSRLLTSRLANDAAGLRIESVAWLATARKPAR